MAFIHPFCGIRPAEAFAPAVAALPYDVYTRAEAKTAVQNNPLSFLRIDRAETQFPDSVDMYSDEIYNRARDTFWEMVKNGVFIRDDSACFYLYALTMNGRTQTGIVGCAAIDDYLSGAIRKHENTRAEKESDRIRHVDCLSAQTGPIFLAYRQEPRLEQITRKIKNACPLYNFVSEDGVRHQVWKTPDAKICGEISHIFEEISHIYIADGHHRAASAVKTGLKRRKLHPGYSGNEEFNYFLSVLFPAEELKIYSYNRVIDDLNGHSLKKLLELLTENFTILPLTDAAIPEKKGCFTMYCNGTWYRLTAKPHLYSEDPVDTLDVSTLQNYVLKPFLGITNPRTDSRIHFIGGIRGLTELVRIVDEQPGRLAFALYPTSMEELLAVADAGRLMPPKSTWFEPKLRSGLFIHEIER